MLAEGERTGRRVRILRADACQAFHLADFIYDILIGRIAVDFDPREARPGSDGLRNHGTKFRVAPEGIRRLYMRQAADLVALGI